MVIWELCIYKDSPSDEVAVRAYFTNKRAAVDTVQNTYCQMPETPRFSIEPIDVLERETHL